MELLPQPDNSGLDGTLPDQSKESPASIPNLGDNQAAALGCIACLTDRGQTPTGNILSAVARCNEVTLPSATYSVKRLVEQDLVSTEERNNKPASGQQAASKHIYNLTDHGSNVLPDNWQKCNQAADYQNPFMQLSKRQQKVVRCLSCLLQQGRDPNAADIAACTDLRLRSVNTDLKSITMDGLLDSYAIPKRPGLIGIAATTAHKPTKETKDSLPTPPDIQACGFAKKETELTLALLTPAQQRMLRCIACITQKTSNIYGAEKAAVEACGGISPDARYGKKMQNLGLIEQHKGFQKVDTKNPARIFYSLTESGAKAANTLPENDDCQPPDTSPEPARVRDIVESCLHCIWSKQIAAGEPAAATAQMLSHCNGADTSQIRRNLSAIVNAGAARRAEGSPENTSDPKHQKLIVIPPAKLAKLRGASEHCKSSLYPDIPAAYLEPVLFGSLPGFEKSNDADIPTIRAFIELHRGQTLLTKEQVLDLGRTIQDPSTSEAVRAQAVTTFVERNVSLAVWYVQNKANFERLFLSFEDAVQEALLGIEASAKHFDPTFDVQFSTYTIFWMKQAVQRAAAAQAGVPSNPFVEMPLSYYAATDFEAIHGRPPTVIELAHARDTTPQVIRRMLKARQSIQKQGLSLDFAFDGNSGRGRMYGESTFHDIIGFTQSDFSSIETYEATHKLAKHLTAPERAMLGSILGYHKMSQALIGREFDMSRDRLKRSQERVTSLLRHPYFGIAAGHDRSQDWQLDAACAKSEMSAIVEDVNANAVVPSDVARMCGFCPVRAECFKSTLKTPVPVTAGIWAGFNPVQLREYRKRAQAARAKATR